MYSNHEFISEKTNDTFVARRMLAQAKHNHETAPSLYYLLFGEEAPDTLKQSSGILARILCGDLYYLDSVLYQCEPQELLDSFNSEYALWNEYLQIVTEKKAHSSSQVGGSEGDTQSPLQEVGSEGNTIKSSQRETSERPKINLELLESGIKEHYKTVKKSIKRGDLTCFNTKNLFGYALLGRVAFELRSAYMAKGAFLYGLWLTTLPYHADATLDVTLEPRHKSKAFDKVLGKSAIPAFLFHSFYYSDAGKFTMEALEPIHRRSGFYWMRIAKNLGLASFPPLAALEQALRTTTGGKGLLPLEYYHRHFLDTANSNGSNVKTLFPEPVFWEDSLGFLLSTELPAEFPRSLKSYQLSIYFKLLLSDPHLSVRTRKECLIKIEPFYDPRFEWVKSSSLLPLTRWTSEIARFQKKPFALELHQMFYPLITQSASGRLVRMKEHIVRYLHEGKIGNLRVHEDESPAYVASLMLRSLEFMAKNASEEEQPLIKAKLTPLSNRIDFLMNTAEPRERKDNLTFEQAFGDHIYSFVITASMGNTTKLNLRDEFRKPGQPIELTNSKKSKFSSLLYSMAFDSNVLELISYVYPGAMDVVMAVKAVAEGIASGSVEESIQPVFDQIPIDEETGKSILDSAKLIDADVEWLNQNSNWLKHFPYAADLLKFYKQCTTWDTNKGYKLPSNVNGMVYLYEMLNTFRPADGLKVARRLTLAIDNHYIHWTKQLSPKSQYLFADAVAHALLGGLIVRHKMTNSSRVEVGSPELFEELHQCIAVHGKSILALAPPLLKIDGSTITATDIVNSSSSTYMQSPQYPALDHFGIFKSAPITREIKPSAHQLKRCC